MEIPVLNLYYLLCYAWNRLNEAEVVSASTEEATSLLNLFARVLVTGTQYIVKRGLDRGYLSFEEEMRGIRGRVAFSPTLKRILIRSGKLCCLFDELDHNVLHNRILKTTIRYLVTRDDVDQKLKSDLADSYRRLHGVEEITLDSNVFTRVQIHRNNIFYGFLMDVCEMIYHYYLVSENIGESNFKDFTRDEEKMSKVFEDFVRNFYKIELEGKYPGYAVKGAETIWWDVSDSEGSDIQYLPKMITDISMTTPKGYLIIDTKYYMDALKGQWSEKIISANLYQLFAYLKNIEKRGEVYTGCEGMLLYPTVKMDLNMSYIIQGHKISIRTINLGEEWENIHSNLLSMVGAKIDPSSCDLKAHVKL